MTPIEKKLRQLRTRIGKLAPTEGRPIARRNARKRVLAALRALREQIDEEYPAIIVRGEVKRLKTQEGRVARLRRQGWRELDDNIIADYAVAGVPVRKVSSQEHTGSINTRFFVPGWAVAIGRRNPSKLRAAKKSVALQHAALAAEALIKGD